MTLRKSAPTKGRISFCCLVLRLKRYKEFMLVNFNTSDYIRNLIFIEKKYNGNNWKN